MVPELFLLVIGYQCWTIRLSPQADAKQKAKPVGEKDDGKLIDGGVGCDCRFSEGASENTRKVKRPRDKLLYKRYERLGA